MKILRQIKAPICLGFKSTKLTGTKSKLLKLTEVYLWGITPFDRKNQRTRKKIMENSSLFS